MAITTDEDKAHGLLGSLEEPDWPRLKLAEVDALLRRYPQAGGADGLLSFSPRPFSAASVVATPRGKVFVKRHHESVRDRAGLLEEHRLIAFLAATMADSEVVTGLDPGLVRTVLADVDGETVVTAGEWTYEVHPMAEGADVYEEALSWTPFLSSGHARAAGRALAQVHRAAEGYDAPARKVQQLVTSFSIFGNDKYSNAGPMMRMDDYLERRPLLRMYAEQREWRKSLDELLMPLYFQLELWLGYLVPQWTHNDFHASNLMWSGVDERASVRGVVDFGLADRTNAVHDLATAIERNIVEWLRMGERDAEVVHRDHLDALLAGYEELRPLNYEEAKALIAMLPLVHCEFALSETDYFLSILHSEKKAYLAYEGYFLAHAEWFQSPQGRRLLTHLQRWAERGSRSNGNRRGSEL